jgi:hypothetical protein
VFLYELKHRNAAVLHDVIVVIDGHVGQRKQLSGKVLKITCSVRGYPTPVYPLNQKLTAMSITQIRNATLFIIYPLLTFTPLNGGCADEKVMIYRRADCLCSEAG